MPVGAIVAVHISGLEIGISSGAATATGMGTYRNITGSQISLASAALATSVSNGTFVNIIGQQINLGSGVARAVTSVNSTVHIAGLQINVNSGTVSFQPVNVHLIGQQISISAGRLRPIQGTLLFPDLYYNPDGTPLTSGTLRIYLNRECSANSLQSGIQLCSIPVNVPIITEGFLQGVAQVYLWNNSRLSPPGSYYVVEAYNALGEKVYGPMKVTV